MKTIAVKISLCCKTHNFILTVIHRISCLFLILPKTFNSSKKKIHIDTTGIDSYTYNLTANAIMYGLLNHQQKWWKDFKMAALIYVLIVTAVLII